MTPHETFFRSPFSSRIPHDLPCCHCQLPLTRFPEYSFNMDLFRCNQCNRSNTNPCFRYDFFVDSANLIPQEIYLGCRLNDQTLRIELKRGQTTIVDQTSSPYAVEPIVRTNLPFPIHSYEAITKQTLLYLTFS